jgi:hypothetical protein
MIFFYLTKILAKEIFAQLKLVFEKKIIATLIFEKTSIFSPKFGKNLRKL